MSFAEGQHATGSGALHVPGQRRKSRLHLVYFALAGFDIIAISCTLFLSHTIMSTYERSVRTSREWASHVSDLAVLGELARQTNAPGNDVFESGDVALERARRDGALLEFNTQWEKLSRGIAESIAVDDLEPFSNATSAIRQSMDEMVLESEKIFSWIETGDEERAGHVMASMDRSYGRLTRSILSAVNEVQAIQIDHLTTQVQVAQRLRVLEFAIGVLIVTIVISVAIYGSKIAEHVRLNEDRHGEMIARLEAAQAALRHYADNVAHELRSPINKILVGSEVVLSRARSIEDYQEALLSNMEESQSLARIVDSLLFMAKAEHVGGQLDRHPVRVARELALIESFYEATAAEAGVAITMSCDPDLVFWLDRVLFQRAISNLVSNAISHTPPGGSVGVMATADESGLSVAVTDTGEGIAAEVRERIFNRFYRADEARSATSGRFGLGLPITKSIVDLHGGAITLRSEVGLGTTVALAFPASAAG
jgi:two-component system, OmpR family, heavy metal sensor histidine kinase CusS